MNPQERMMLVRKMLEVGYQVDPAALEYLGITRGANEILKLLMELVAERGYGQANQYSITLDWVRRRFPPENEEVYVSGSGVTGVAKVLLDGSSIVGPSLNPEDYGKMCLDRLAKSYSILKLRSDFKEVIPIARISKIGVDRRRPIKIAGIVLDKKVGIGQSSLVIEDRTGSLRVISSGSLKKKFDDVLLDEVLLLEISVSEKGYVCEGISHVDVLEARPNRSSEDIYAVFISDLHLGSNNFDYEKWGLFIAWINGDLGELDIVRKVRFLIIGGDLGGVPNRGVSQRGSLTEQYAEIAEMLRDIPEIVQVFIIPGESDASRVIIPQPAIFRNFAKVLYSMENVRMLGNPSIISLNGVKVLLFHGQSLSDVMTQIGSGDELPHELMRGLLRARHLAPSYGLSTDLEISESDKLFLIDIPDIFFCGHTHVSGADLYKGILLLSTSSWALEAHQNVTGKVAVVNLKTLEVFWRG